MAVASGAVKQVTKSNFSASLHEIKGLVKDADFVAVSSKKTGDPSRRRPWLRSLPIDTPETAYLKAKLAAETYQLLHFAVCPFRFHGSKLLAFPYNFHLFPRDELSLGMPSYSFNCQTSFLTSIAQQGFDFNVCIYDGISYLSRVQESKARERITIPRLRSMPSSPNLSVADSIFMGRIKARVEHWWNACKDPGKPTDGPLVKSLRKLILGGEDYGSRPCMTVDVCNDRQALLVSETVSRICHDLVPLVVPDKGGEPNAVRVVLTSSEEDKNLLVSEIEDLEEEKNLKIRGFREVIDVISNSHKPIVAYNCLHDFTFIHSNFLAPLPQSPTEFMCSLRMAFPNILDVNHLLKEVGPLRKAKNLQAAFSYLKRQFFVPIDMEIPQQAAEGNNEKDHGHEVLQLTHVFAKLGNLLKIVPGCGEEKSTSIEDYANTFYPCCSNAQESEDEDVAFFADDIRRTSANNLVFLWGFDRGISAAELKLHLRRTHYPFTEDFELQLVDKTCAVLVFWRPSFAETLLGDIRSGKMLSEGLKATGYEDYRKACRLGLWEGDLADSLEEALMDSADSVKDECEVYWNSELMIDLNAL